MKSNIYILLICAAAAVVTSVAILFLTASTPAEMGGLFERWFNTLSADTQHSATVIAKAVSIGLPGTVAALSAVVNARRRANEKESGGSV